MVGVKKITRKNMPKSRHKSSHHIQGLKKDALANWQLYVIIALPVLYLLIFHYYPMYGIQLAFKKFYVTRGMMASPWVGLKYFKMFFTAPSCWPVIRNTLMLSITSLIIGFPFPIILAIALNETRSKKFAKTVQMVTYAPYFISTVVMVGMLFQVLDPNIGFVNKMIKALGFESIRFMESSKYFRSIYVWSGIWQGMGYSAIIYLAALAGVNPELQEAAVIDGASRLQRIMHVDLPAISSTIVILLILNFGGIMSVGFEKAYLMQNSMNAGTAEIIATYVYKSGMVNGNLSFATAVGLFQSIVNLILLISVNKIARKVSDSSLF